jgi:hypothetical protein
MSREPKEKIKSKGGVMNRIHVWQVIGKKTLADTDSKSVPIPDESRLVHLQFRRFHDRGAP